MRPKMKYNRNEISFLHEKKSVYIISHCGRNEIECCVGNDWSESAH